MQLPERLTKAVDGYLRQCPPSPTLNVSGLRSGRRTLNCHHRKWSKESYKDAIWDEGATTSIIETKEVISSNTGV